MLSFIGCIGVLMNESGLLECLEMQFKTNTIPKMMDEKAISKAICTHFLTEGSLMAKLFATFVSGKCWVEIAEAEEVEEAEENVEMNNIKPDVVNEGITDKNGNENKRACTLKYLRV